MDPISAIIQLGTLLVAVIGVWIALTQFRSASHDAHMARQAEMSWQLYQAYVEPRIRNARGAAEVIAHSAPILQSGDEYATRYADKEQVIPEVENPTLDTHMRRLLRFYNHAGILLGKNLADEDLVLALIGPGLKASWSGISAAINFYQTYEYCGGTLGIQKCEPRPLYTVVSDLYERYLIWEQEHNPTNGA